MLRHEILLAWWQIIYEACKDLLHILSTPSRTIHQFSRIFDRIPVWNLIITIFADCFQIQKLVFIFRRQIPYITYACTRTHASTKTRMLTSKRTYALTGMHRHNHAHKCMHACSCTHAHAHTHAHMHAHPHMLTHALTQAHLRTHVRTHAHARTRTHTGMHTRTHIYFSRIRIEDPRLHPWKPNISDD